MATASERNWTAHIVTSSEHAELKPYFKAFEAEMYRVLARCDNPRDVMFYVQALLKASGEWQGRREIARPAK